MDNNLLITGGTGFVGSAFIEKYHPDYRHIYILTRKNPSSLKPKHSNISYINDFTEITQVIHSVINLAGEPIADKPWTKKRKQILRDSRITLTEKLLEWITTLEQKPMVLVSGSAIGYYGDQGDKEVIETSPPHQEFAHELCRDWEESALKANDLGIRTCVIRTGIVIGKNQGFMKKLVPPFKLGIGIYFGNGQHWMSWVHVQDLIAMIQHMITHEHSTGAYNAVAPYPITHKEFAQTLARQLKTRLVLPFPAIIAKTVFGEMSELLLTGQKVIPQRFIEENFSFSNERIQGAIAISL